MKLELLFEGNGIHSYIEVNVFCLNHRKEDINVLLRVLEIIDKYNEDAIKNA